MGLPSTCVSSVCCPLYDPLLWLTWALAEDWLTTRQHHPHSSSHWDQTILVATKETCWEEDSAGRFQVPDLETHPQAAKTQPGPAFHHTSELQHSITTSPHHAGALWDIPCVLPQPGRHNWVTYTKVLFPWKVSQLNNIVVILVLFKTWLGESGRFFSRITTLFIVPQVNFGKRTSPDMHCEHIGRR